MACLKLTLPTRNAQQNVVGAVVLSRGRALEGPLDHGSRGVSRLKDCGPFHTSFPKDVQVHLLLV